MVLSLSGYFEVPKTKWDIRVVLDVTRCGLNEVVWAPNFFIPSVDSMLSVLDKDSWMGDIDLGEMFLTSLWMSRFGRLWELISLLTSALEARLFGSDGEGA